MQGMWGGRTGSVWGWRVWLGEERGAGDNESARGDEYIAHSQTRVGVTVHGIRPANRIFKLAGGVVMIPA